MRECHSAGPVVWTLEPSESTATVSVLADWTRSQVDAYAEAHAIPKLELYARGYTSIGCEPCTAVPDDPANPRAGRWGGKKLECGIHTFSGKMV